MSTKFPNEKSRNENNNIDENHLQTAEPSCLYEIKNISKDLINIIKTEMDSIVQLLHSIHEEIKKKFANSQLLNKIEEIFDKNLELILNYFIRCFQHTDTVKISITNNIINGLTNIQNSARILTEQYLAQENIQDFQKSSNFFQEEEFVKLINSLSTSIKEFMKDNNSVMKIINGTTESLNDQLSTTKTTISDLLTQLNNNLLMQNSNQMKYSQKQGGTQPTTKDKIFKDKLSSLADKIDILSSLKSNLAKNLKFVDNYCSKFYADSKGIFKQLKTLHTKKLSGIINQNNEFNHNANNLIANENNLNPQSNNNYSNHNFNQYNNPNSDNSNYDNNNDLCNQYNNPNLQNNENLFKFSNNFQDCNNAQNNSFINNNNINNKSDNFNNFNQSENNFGNSFNSNFKNYTGNTLKKFNSHSNNKSLKKLNKSLNSSQLNNMTSTSSTHNKFLDSISPMNKRKNSTNFNYNIDINEIRKNTNYNNISNNEQNLFRESRTNSNPKYSTKPFTKNNPLNSSAGKVMNISNLNIAPGTPNNFSNYNNYISQTTKNANLNKSGESFKSKRKIKSMNTSMKDYINQSTYTNFPQNSSHKNNNLNAYEFSILKKNEELSSKVNELMEEISGLHQSYNVLIEEYNHLKNSINSSSNSAFNANQNNNTALKKNSKSLNKFNCNRNINDDNNNNKYRKSLVNANYDFNNLCAKCSCQLDQNNNLSNCRKSNSNNRKLSTDLNNNNYNNAVYSESNETVNNNNNNLNLSENSCSNPNSINNNNIVSANLSASEQFYAKKNYKDKLIEIYTLSEKVLLFVDLLQKLQDEISSKSPYVKEFKVLFGETKTELVKSANESYNKAKIDLEKELNNSSNVQNSLNLGALKLGSLNKSMNKASTYNLTNNNSKSKLSSKKGGNKRNYNSTILNYAIKKVDSNNYSSYQNQDNYIMENHPSHANYSSNNENKNIEKNNSYYANNSQVNYPNNQKRNISASEINNNNNHKRKSYLNQNLRNFTDNNNASSINIIGKIQESQMENMDITENEDEDDYNKYNYKEEIREESNTLQNMQSDYEENLKNLNQENIYLKELNENIVKEINELKEMNSNLLNDNQEKGNLIEELNDKVLQINQKLVDSLNEFNNQNNENYLKLQEQERKIHELLNDLNITKLTNQALYAEINQRDIKDPNNNENEQNEVNENEEDEGDDYDNINNKNISLNEMDMKTQEEKEGSGNRNSINEQNNFNQFNFQNNNLNSLQNKEEDEKYILNMEIEKQISENIQSQKLIETLRNDLEKLNVRYENLSKENNKTSEMIKNIKNENADLEKSIAALNKELEKVTKENLMRESNNSNILSKKVKENEGLNKLIDEFKSREKADKAEINNQNSKIENLEKQLLYSKDSVNELQIKIKVNKNEKESLTGLVDKLNKEKENLDFKLTETSEKLAIAEKEKALLETRFINLEKELNLLAENNEKLKKEKDISSRKSNELDTKCESLMTEKNNLEASYLKLNQEFSELKKQLNVERKENDLNSINKIMDLEAEISKLKNSNNSKETEIKLLNKKIEELKFEIKSLTKSLDNHSIEANNFKKIEENLKTEIKNLIKSEENGKAEIKLLFKKEENLTEDIKKLKLEIEAIKEKGKNSELLLKEKSAINDNLKIEIDKLKGSKEELNAKIKNICDNEGILKLEIEKYVLNENTLKFEMQSIHNKENDIKKENLLLLQTEESLRAELNNLVKENKHYKELFSNFNKDENEKEKGLKTALIELENDKKNLNEKFEHMNNEYHQLKKFNEDVLKEKENLTEKLKQTEKSMKTLKFERDDFRAEVENLKVLTEDYDLKCNRIDELENKIAKLKSEIREKTNEEILKLNKIVAEKSQLLEKMQAENIKLQNNINELSIELDNKSKLNTLDENKMKSCEDIEAEKNSLADKLEKINKEADMEKENKIKLKNLNETQLNYLLRFSDKFLDINNNAIINIEQINSKLSSSDFLYQIPILDIINEINFSDLKDTFQRIRSNNIVESYNAIISFFNEFFEEKILKIPDTINDNFNNISDKFIKTYQDFQAKNSTLTKLEKDFKIANEKLKNSEIEKINLTTFLDGKEQECDQLLFKLADVEKKYKNFRDSQKANIEKSELKIENLEKENNRLLEAFSKLQAELEFVLDENEKLKNERDQLNNLDNIGFGHFSNSNNLLNPASSNRISDCNKETFSHRNSNLFALAEEAHKNLRQQPLQKTLSMNNDDIQEADFKENSLNDQNNYINFDSNKKINKKINSNINNNSLKNLDIENDINSLKNTNKNNVKNNNDISNNRNSASENELRNKLVKMEQKFNELSEENKKLKFVFDECIQMIYEAIKTYSPNLFEDPNEGYEGGSKLNSTLNNQNLLTINNIPDSKGSKNSILSMNSNYSFSTDKDMIPKAVEMFKKYNKEINEKSKRLEAQVNELELNSRTYKIMADEYKNAWELAMKKNDNIQFGNLYENIHEQAEPSERLKTDFGNFTVDDLIEAGHINLDEFSKNSSRKNENLKKKISGKNMNLNMLNVNDSNNNPKNNNNINILNINKEYNEVNDLNKKQEKLPEKKEKVEITLINEPEKKAEEKFSFENYLEKFNNPSEYKILAYKKLNNDLIWYLLISKNTLNNSGNNSLVTNKNEFENKVERNFARNTSDINELDLTMINKIKKKSSNNMLNYSSIEDANEKRNLSSNNNNLVKNYNFYMWVPGKLIANNLTNFEFEKNYSENQQESGRNLQSGNKDIVPSQKTLCEKCEKSKKDINNNILHLNELEKKYTAMLDEKDLEIKQLLKVQEDLKDLISKKEKDIENYKESCDKHLKANVEKAKYDSDNKYDNNSNSLKEKTVSLEKYEMLLNEFQDEQDKAYELMKVYEQLKIDYDNMAKKLLSLTKENNCITNNLSNKSNNANNKIFNNTILETETIEAKAMNKSFNNKTNNAFKDLNEFEALDLLEMYNRNSLGGISDLKEIAQKLNKNFNTVPTGSNVNNKTAMNSSNNMNINTENYDGNDFTLNKTEGYYTHDNIKEAVSDFEKNERLLMEQLMEIKDELKQTRNERDLFKKKYNDSTTLQDGKKEEILNILRSAVEKLINEIQLTPKIKELLTVILKICDFDEEQIANIFRDKEQKKKSFFGFIRK